MLLLADTQSIPVGAQELAFFVVFALILLETIKKTGLGKLLKLGESNGSASNEVAIATLLEVKAALVETKMALSGIVSKLEALDKNEALISQTMENTATLQRDLLQLVNDFRNDLNVAFSCGCPNADKLGHINSLLQTNLQTLQRVVDKQS